MKRAQRKPSKTIKQVSKKSSRAVSAKAAPARNPARARNGAGDLSRQLASIQERLKNLEDILEITRLKAAYCDAVDGGWDRKTHDGAAVAKLFVEDGVWNAGKIGGRARGHQGITDLINSYTRIPFAFHRVTNPDIRVDGDKAKGNWHVIAYLTQPDRTPTMFFGVYNDEFVRTPQGWKFKTISGAAACFPSLREGWGVGDYYKSQAAPVSETSLATEQKL